MSTTTRRNLGTFLLLILGFIIIYKAMNINEVIFFDEFTPKNYYMRPDNFEETCKLDKNCGTECDVCCELPYHVDTGLIVHHHYKAQTGKWIEKQRFEKLNFNNGLIIYIGGNVQAGDAPTLMNLCPNCKLHIFEPIPQFNEQLEKKYKELAETNNWDVTVHKFGLGATNRIIKLPASAIQGVRTDTMAAGSETKDGEQYVELPIKTVEEALKDLDGEIDLIHMNCEGCEWEVFENIIDNNIDNRIKQIQWSAHFSEFVENITKRYCNILEVFKKTRTKVYGQSWSWERWDLNE